MTQIQIDLNEQENEIVSIYKIRNKLITKADAIKKIVRESSKK